MPDQSLVTILVTGAAGFIGRQITRRLAAEPGFFVRAGSRQGHAVGHEAQPVRTDVLDPASLVAAFAGVDAVVHCAVGDRATTIFGTDHVVQAAKQAGVQRIVHLSSIAVYGQAAGKVAENEKLLACPEYGGGYAHWKAGAEAVCRSLSGPRVVMLRPTIVYGAGSEQWIALPARRILARRWGTMGPAGEGLCNPVHVTDVAEAALAALRADVAHGEAFNINGPTALTWNGWFNRLAHALGQPELPAIAPAQLYRRSLAAVPVKALLRALPALRGQFEWFLLGAPAASERALFRLQATYPTDKARTSLGWQPRIDLDEGLADAMTGLQMAGMQVTKP
jgi:nucleoside-diphosphate-sugar epimerase